MLDIKFLHVGERGGEARGREGAGLIFFIYYFIYVIIKTLYVSSFIVVYVIYFTYS